jgi:hypothetical protein
MKRFTFSHSVCFFLSLFLFSVSAEADFVRVDSIPRAVTRPYGNISTAFLPDGRLVVWDGNAIYLQPLHGADEVRQIASGYAGDTAFMAVAPDGHTLLLGAGMSGKLYRFDTSAPADYSPAALLGTYSHYWGAFLTQSLVVIDRVADDWTTDQLAIIDISAPDLAPRVVMNKPAAADVPVGGFAASAALAVDASGSWLYTMAAVFDSSFAVVANPLKKIPAAQLITAYQDQSVLDWNDFDAIGAGPYATGGPVAATNSGNVLLAGFGGVQEVDCESGAVIATYSPGGFVYHGAAYDRATDTVFPLATDDADYTMDLFYAPDGAFHAMPVSGNVALAALLTALATLGAARILRRRHA